MNREIVKTKDHSSTLFVPELDQHYHSMHGALQESMHVFIAAGLHLFKNKSRVSIFETGLGTGLNALLTALEAENLNLKINYTAIEKYPLSMDEMLQLNYGEMLEGNTSTRLLTELHQLKWNEKIELTPSLDILKLEGDIKDHVAKEVYDLIYFDAFAPSAQPDLWTVTVFENMFHSLKKDGVLVTYCVKGDVRRNMKSAGFEVEKIPGPPGKREMARAWKR